MTRYIRQRDKYSCGPHVVLNSLKWAGHRVSVKKDFNRIKKLCECESGHGTEQRDLDLALQHFDKRNKFKVKARYVHPTIGLIDENLTESRAIIIKYRWPGKPIEGGHYALIIGKKEDRYILVNDSTKKTIKLRKRSTLVKMLRSKFTYKKSMFDAEIIEKAGCMIWVLEKIS